MFRSLLMALVAIGLASAAVAAQPRYQIEVAGLACPFCAYGIEKKLRAIEGVERVETNIKEGTVVVVLKEGATLDRARVERAVREAGFTLKGFRPVSPGGH
ncbi:heavy-metal-associated domain-containing protein [Sphingomonas sp.]|uniref:heavy-metal-associated domain-containing protein n=1 Tax=Sphingomonas sp. TaxID=28214 RepID=UPI00307D1ED6